MKKSKILKALAIGLPMVALLSIGVVAGLGNEQPNGDINDGGPGDGDDCICPHIYDPVVCNVNGERVRFSNACFAGCAGATKCISSNSLNP